MNSRRKSLLVVLLILLFLPIALGGGIGTVELTLWMVLLVAWLVAFVYWARQPKSSTH